MSRLCQPRFSCADGPEELGLNRAPFGADTPPPRPKYTPVGNRITRGGGASVTVSCTVTVFVVRTVSTRPGNCVVTRSVSVLYCVTVTVSTRAARTPPPDVRVVVDGL